LLNGKNVTLPSRLLKKINLNFYHGILVVGYDEINDTIYYNDPMSALWNYPDEGTYADISFNDFKIAIERGSPYREKYLGVFENNIIKHFNRTEIFLKAHERNIEKMKGNRSVYDPILMNITSDIYGVNVLERLLQNMTGMNNISHIFHVYKMSNSNKSEPIYYFLLLFMEKFFPEIFTLSDYQNLFNFYYQISVEKLNTSKYLKTLNSTFKNETVINLCKFEANLLKNESEKWAVLGNLYLYFMKFGRFLSSPWSICIINEMRNNINTILEIQNSIINGPDLENNINNI
jgi:hypothetical protein